MKRFKIVSGLVLIGALALTFTMCKKDVIEITPVNLPNTTGLDTGLSNIFYSRQVRPQKFAVTHDRFNTLYMESGTVLAINANSFVHLNNDSVTGPIDLFVREVYSKSDMVLSNLTTISDGGPLISGGMLYLDARRNGQKLKLAKQSTIYAKIPTTLTQNERSGMLLFYGTTSQTDTTIVDWEVNNFFDTIQVRQDSASNIYGVTIDSLGWINCDYFWGIQPQTEVKVRVPAGQDKDNTAIYIVFRDESSVTAIRNFTNGAFTTSPSYTLPVGQQMLIVGIGVVNGKYVSSFTESTVLNQHDQTITFKETTLEDFETELRVLVD